MCHYCTCEREPEDKACCPYCADLPDEPPERESAE